MDLLNLLHILVIEIDRSIDREDVHQGPLEAVGGREAEGARRAVRAA